MPALPILVHSVPSVFSPLPAGIQSLAFAIPAGTYIAGTITRQFVDNNPFWSEAFSTAGGSDPYNLSSSHQCFFAPDTGDAATHIEAIALTAQQIADINAAAGGTLTGSLNHTTTGGPAPNYGDFYLTLTVGTPPPGTPGTFFAPGYQSIPTTPADAILEVAGTDRFVVGAHGSADLSILINLGAPASVGSIDWQDGTAHTYTGLWEHSNDAASWSPVSMPAPPTPTGVFQWTPQSLTLGSPVTAQYWRLSVQDAPGGATIGQAGVKEAQLKDPGTSAPVRPVGSYCRDAAFTLSGHWHRYGGTIPHKNAWLTLFYKTCKSPVRQANAHRQPGTYCANGDLQRMSVQTDCTGAFSFAPVGSILAAGLAYGQWIENPDYDPDADLTGLPADQVARLSNQFLLDPATAGQYGCCTFSGSSGTWTYPAGYTSSLPSGGTVTSNIYSQGGTMTDASNVGSAYQTPCGDAQVNGAYSRQNAAVFQLWQIGTLDTTQSYPLSGAFTLDFRDNTASVPNEFYTYITKNGKWYSVSNVALTVTDGCGASDSLTSFTGALSTVDWPNLASITVTSTIPPCGFADGYPSPDDPNIRGPISSPVPQNGRRLWNLGSALDPLLTGCVGSAYATVVVLADCSSTATPSRADVFEGTRTLGVAWVNAAGKLLTAVHRAPLANIGDSATGWEANQTIEAVNAASPGYQFLHTGRAYLDYQLSSANRYRTNDMQGAGPATNWSAAAAQSVVGAAAAGRSPLGDWRFVLSGTTWQFLLCNDNRGAGWSLVTAASGATGSGCGGAWLGTGFGLLFNRASDGHAVFRKTQKPDDWSGATSIDTGSSLTVAGLVMTPTGTLLGLLWNPSTKRSRAIRSRDRGATWELGIISEIIPALDTPPALTHLDFAAIACWQTGDQPLFAVSVNEGDSWS